MRSLLIVLLLVAVSAIDRPDVYSIDCDSSQIDPAVSAGTGLTKEKCVQSCKSSCTNIQSEASVENCLSISALDGCLFDLTKVHDVDTDSCVVNTAGAPITLVFTISAEDVRESGNGKNVESIKMVGELANPSEVAKCTSKSVSVGVATTASTSDRNCQFSGSPVGSAQDYTVSASHLTIDITQVFNSAFQPDRPLTLFATFADTSCALAFRDDVDVEFSIKYKDGFRPSATCRGQRTCDQCKGEYCAWCTWSERPRSDVIDYLPDWDYVEDARDDRRGQCGVNSAVCEQTGGRVNFCDASSAHGHLIATNFLLAILLFKLG